MVDYDWSIWTRVEHIVGDAHQCLYYILVWFASADGQGFWICCLFCSKLNRFKVSTGKPRMMIAGLPCSLNLIRDWVIRLVMYCKPNQRLGY